MPDIIQLGELQGDGYPFETIILSGEPIETKQRGRFVVDIDALSYHKTRVLVNYNHNDEIILGYGENFRVTPEGLKSNGKLTSGGFTDEVVKHANQGVPFEASVDINLDHKQVIKTWIDSGEQIVVNGAQHAGPLTVYHNVPLRGYAICPYGADKFTTFTLLSMERDFMKKNTSPKKNAPETTGLSADNEQHAPPSTDMTPAVKSQELADLCAIFGDTNGIKLYQDGTDVNEVRQWQSLNEKYSQYLSADDDEPKQDSEPEPAKDDEPPKSDDSEPKKDDEPAKDKDDEKLSAVLTKLTAMVEKQSTEITKLKAAMPRGAEPVSHGNETLKDEPKKNSVSAAADRYKKRGVKDTQ